MAENNKSPWILALVCFLASTTAEVIVAQDAASTDLRTLKDTGTSTDGSPTDAVAAITAGGSYTE